jgi:probable rRNA maturation factor
MSSDGSHLSFDRCPTTLDRKRLRAFHRRLQTEVVEASFGCLLTHDARLQKLNREFLGHDYPTDVLSFPSGDGLNLGEMAISIERAAEQAAQFNHPLETELEILMLHGALHLKGMDHETDRGAMARQESAWRKKLGLPHGLIRRSRA